MKIGQIYKIQCNKTGLCYYGSTTQSINRRLHGHKTAYNNFIHNKTKSKLTSFLVLENNNYAMSVVEYVEVENMQQRERFYIENNECVNKVIPTRTSKEWAIVFRDKVLGYKKKWRDANVEHMKRYDEEVRKPRMLLRKQQNSSSLENSI